ncbi:TonB-dependent receptor, partial [bacterium]|nr:TonB-dependent receptor [bacterium]
MAAASAAAGRHAAHRRWCARRRSPRRDRRDGTAAAAAARLRAATRPADRQPLPAGGERRGRPQRTRSDPRARDDRRRQCRRPARRGRDAEDPRSHGRDGARRGRQGAADGRAAPAGDHRRPRRLGGRSGDRHRDLRRRPAGHRGRHRRREALAARAGHEAAIARRRGPEHPRPARRLIAPGAISRPGAAPSCAGPCTLDHRWRVLVAHPQPRASPIVRLTLILTTLLCALVPATALGDLAPGDTLLVDLPDLVVRGDEAAPVKLDRTRLEAPVIRRQDAVTLAELGRLLPSARVAVNSRGDAHAMIRGAPERHVTTYLDGIPLNLPWDERVDLASIPTVGIGAIEGRRGVVSVLDGPGTLAGSVRLLPPRLGTDASSLVRATVGDGGRGAVEARHQRRAGAWSLLGAGAWHTRDDWPLPGSGDPRLASDRRQWSGLVRAARPTAGGGRVSLLGAGWTGEQGSPPELHLGDDARFWRYPVRERLVLGGVLEQPLGEAWDLGATVSGDLHHQEIDARGPDRWGAPRVAGDDYETSWDRTANLRLRLTRWVGERATVAVQGSARYTHHREIAAVGAPERDYAQWLTSLATEGELRLDRRWTVRAGAGWDRVAVPQAGDRTPSPDTDAAALNLRLVRDLGRGQAIHLAATRRSRFPSLREAYSGALGRFVVNPDLGPERQDQLELGGIVSGPTWSLEAAGFLTRLEDGIERVAIDETRYQRVNQGRIDVPGLELRGRWTPQADLAASLQHTVLDARVKGDGEERPAEDRPAYIARAEIAWEPAIGPGVAIESRVTGPRWSADGTAPDGLRRLPAGVTWHLRVAWRTLLDGRELELHVRADNLFDQRVDFQTGLPAP